MTIRRRSSRADRRKDEPDHLREERRSPRTTADAQMHSQVHGDEVFIFVTSVLCTTNSAQAKAMLDAHAARTENTTVIVDMERCPYMDTQGLSLLFEFRKALTSSRRNLVLQNPSRPVQRIINITQMARLFAVRMTSVNFDRIPTASGASITPTPGPGKVKFS